MRTTLSSLHRMAQEGNRITQLTCYDASFASVLDAAGVDTILIGDSLGNVIQGHESTLPVTLRDIVYHVSCVARGSKRAFIVGDMPFGTYQTSPQDALRNAADSESAYTRCSRSLNAEKAASSPGWSSAATAKR